jgi:hypothetical protein
MSRSEGTDTAETHHRVVASPPSAKLTPWLGRAGHHPIKLKRNRRRRRRGPKLGLNPAPRSAPPRQEAGRPGFAAPLGAHPPTDKEHDPASLKCQSAYTPEPARVTHQLVLRAIFAHARFISERGGQMAPRRFSHEGVFTSSPATKFLPCELAVARDSASFANSQGSNTSNREQMTKVRAGTPQAGFQAA